jgi:hypothetical protein
MLPISLSVSICIFHVIYSPFIAFIVGVAEKQFRAVLYHRPIFVNGEADAWRIKPIHRACVLCGRDTFSQPRRFSEA